ncbi:hypothetical protein [Halapricum salinum]|uniref:Peptidase C-terminal archaeal/bacterial domain-containing protein n=1 Tax=Halapricum salinum TaxID=1457250 RepID=A0A4D6HC99_9EURY|nr:hypothetical protein [Halapricum salinum]QCC50347.1 hypothetical protein DV733_03440 [Halapricum salinum]
MKRHPERDEKTGIDRRTYLQIAGGAAIVGGAAGCLGGARAEEVRYGYGGERYVLDSTALDAESLNLTAESEPNDACADANPIELDTDISGTLETAGVDWYSFDLSADTAFEVVFDRIPETGVTGVVVYGPNCEFMQLRQVGTSQSVRLAATASEAGTYTVEVTDINSADGEYTVAVDTGSYNTPTPTPEDDYGEAGFGEAGYGGTA